MEYKEAKIIMMERFEQSDLFSQDELDFISDNIIEDKRNGRAIIKLWSLNEFEKMGIIHNFYKVCEKHNYFPDWLRDVREKKDNLLEKYSL